MVDLEYTIVVGTRGFRRNQRSQEGRVFRSTDWRIDDRLRVFTATGQEFDVLPDEVIPAQSSLTRLLFEAAEALHRGDTDAAHVAVAEALQLAGRDELARVRSATRE